MYDETIKSINVTYDECSILKELLLWRLERCVSFGEENTVKELLDKVEGDCS